MIMTLKTTGMEELSFFHRKGPKTNDVFYSFLVLPGKLLRTTGCEPVLYEISFCKM